MIVDFPTCRNDRSVFYTVTQIITLCVSRFTGKKCMMNLVVEKIEINKDVVRAIVVPFRVKNGGVEIGSIMETFAIDIPEGDYGLLFTSKRSGDLEHYTFSFIKNSKQIATVIRADSALHPPDDLLMNANPAIYEQEL